MITKGRHPQKKLDQFRALPEKGGGGFTHARILVPFFFRQKIVPKTSLFVLKRNNICMFFGQFCHHYRQNDHYNYQCNHHNYHWYFFLCRMRQTLFNGRKKGTKLPELGLGGGLGDSGNARKKTFFH